MENKYFGFALLSNYSSIVKIERFIYRVFFFTFMVNENETQKPKSSLGIVIARTAIVTVLGAASLIGYYQLRYDDQINARRYEIEQKLGTEFNNKYGCGNYNPQACDIVKRTYVMGRVLDKEQAEKAGLKEGTLEKIAEEGRKSRDNIISSMPDLK